MPEQTAVSANTWLGISCAGSKQWVTSRPTISTSPIMTEIKQLSFITRSSSSTQMKERWCVRKPPLMRWPTSVDVSHYVAAYPKNIIGRQGRDDLQEKKIPIVLSHYYTSLLLLLQQIQVLLTEFSSDWAEKEAWDEQPAVYSSLVVDTEDFEACECHPFVKFFGVGWTSRWTNTQGIHTVGTWWTGNFILRF